MILSWIKDYQSDFFKNDLIAGLTVGVLLIPQGMAYAIIAGLPPVYGLYSSLVPLIVYAILGTSRQLAVGPVAMDSLLVASFVGTLAKAGTEYYISLALLLAGMIGVIQLLLGVIRFGFLVNFLSRPVISGFTSAAALIIGLGQVKHLIGIDIPRSNHIQALIGSITTHITELSVQTTVIGLASVLLIIGIKKMKLKIPAPLFIVFVGTLVVWGFGLNELGVKIVEDIPGGLPSFQFPEIDWKIIKTMAPMAGTLALVGFMESISVAKAIQAKHENYKINSNQELIALGSANLIGSLFQSYPVTGGFSRSAVNDQSGAKTPLASIISAMVIGLTLIFLTPLFYYLPKSVLAAIIMVAVFGLVDVKYPIQLWKYRKIELLMLLTTFIVTLTVGITVGISVGVALSIIVVVFMSTKPHVAYLGKIPGTNQYRNIHRFEGLEQREDVIILRFDNPMYFANASFIKDTVISYAEKAPKLKHIILNMESVGIIDSSALTVLREINRTFEQKSIKLLFTGTIGPVRDVMHRSGFIKEVGEDKFFLDIHFAMDYIDGKMTEESSKQNIMALQTNLHKSD